MSDDKSNLCGTCNKEPARELHECPFRVEIEDDRTFRCNCCENCTHECAMDV